MRTASIFHGTGGTPDSFWLPAIAESLRARGVDVWAPQLPNSNHPSIDEWLPFALQHGNFSEDSILIGHSTGCPLILAILERLTTPVKQAILVAGFAQPLPSGTSDILQQTYNWEDIRSNVQDVIIINSDNDPLGCDDT